MKIATAGSIESAGLAFVFAIVIKAARPIVVAVVVVARIPEAVIQEKSHRGRHGRH